MREIIEEYGTSIALSLVGIAVIKGFSALLSFLTG